MPKGMSRAFLCNSGSEANEAAIKTARRVTGRREVISMRNGFHGRTMGSLSATALDNLGKGMVTQAIQNLNLMFGLEETAGLRRPGGRP